MLLSYEPKPWELEEAGVVDAVSESVRVLAHQLVEAAKGRLSAAGEDIGRLDDLPAALVDAIEDTASQRWLLEMHLQKILGG